MAAAPPANWKSSTDVGFPMSITVRYYLTYYCDLTALPRRSDLKLLAEYCGCCCCCCSSSNGGDGDGDNNGGDGGNASSHEDNTPNHSNSNRHKEHALNREFLRRLASHPDEYKTKFVQGYIERNHLLQLLQLSNTIPLAHWIALFQRLQPRLYTISSSAQVHPNTIHLTVAVTQAKRRALLPRAMQIPQSNDKHQSNNNLYNKNDDDNNNKDKDHHDNVHNNNDDDDDDDSIWFRGLCSSFLARRPRTLRALVRPSSFRLPHNPSTPILLIGPGTGIAPMRTFLQEQLQLQQQQQQQQQQSTAGAVGPTILYFGCHAPDVDFLYHDELREYQRQGTLTELHVAFSRPSDGSKSPKVYVQHLLLQPPNAASTYRYIVHEQAYVYVCGGVPMGHDVHAALEQILAMPPSPLPPFVPETSSQLQSPHDNVLSSLSMSPDRITTV
ncbi:hypothetical protein ACA910_005520 [Epithemia clementina (nom. ined.)]